MTIRAFPLLAFLVAMLAVLTQPAIANNNDPETFIQDLADEALSLLASRDGSLERREERFRTMLREQFLMENIGRFVAGNHWRAMSEQQQGEYQDLFSEWVLRTYSRRLGGYSGERLQVLNTVPATRDDVFVRTEIQGPTSAPIKCDWRVRPVDGSYKIVDVVVEGVSMAVTQRQEFGPILDREGPDGLIERLRTQLAQL